MTPSTIRLAGALALCAGLAALALAMPVSAQPILSWEPPFRAIKPVQAAYTPASPASKPWTLCVVVPHIKDAYWLGVNYGMVEEARRRFPDGVYEKIEQYHEQKAGSEEQQAAGTVR